MIVLTNQKKQQKILANFSFNLLDYERPPCSKSFARKYGLSSHQLMSHTNHSTFCSECNLTFRSHRTFKTHQQRFHFTSAENASNYHYLSSNLVLPFSSQQFVYLTSNACEQGRFPLGEFSSKLYACQVCSIAFPSSYALNYHLLNQHEQYEYATCKQLLREMIFQIEDDLRMDDEDKNDLQTMSALLAQQASSLGLIEKSLANKRNLLKKQNQQFIFPTCEHNKRTCANLCLKYLSSYNQLIQNYPYQISTLPKGNPFLQGSIVSNPSNHHSSSTLKENSNANPKRIRSSPSSPSKKALNKTNQTYTRSLSSMSSTSSTSTRSSLKRSLSPTINLAVERSSDKRRRPRQRRKAKIPNDIEQENDDNDDTHAVQSKKKGRERQASNSSVEYVQVIHTDQTLISSLNNIENLKSKSPVKSDDEIIICHTSSPKKKPAIPTAPPPAPSDYDEQIRVRCKICGDIIEGRSQFSQHVLTMHSHVLKSNLPELKQSATTVLCSI